jgi:hypothetical protein
MMRHHSVVVLLNGYYYVFPLRGSEVSAAQGSEVSKIEVELLWAQRFRKIVVLNL